MTVKSSETPLLAARADFTGRFRNKVIFFGSKSRRKLLERSVFESCSRPHRQWSNSPQWRKAVAASRFSGRKAIGIACWTQVRCTETLDEEQNKKPADSSTDFHAALLRSSIIFIFLAVIPVVAIVTVVTIGFFRHAVLDDADDVGIDLFEHALGR